MDFLPLFLDLRGRKVVVVGGGEIAARKADLLHQAGASVLIVAPLLCAALQAQRLQARLEHRASEFQPDHLDGAALVIAATDDSVVNATVARVARERNLFVNVVDDAGASNCLMPAIIDRGPLLVAVGTSGQSPSIARRVRSLIESALPERLGELVALAGRWRERVRAALPDLDPRRQFWDRWLSRALAGGVSPAELETELGTALSRAVEAPPGQLGEVWLIGAGPGDPDLLTLRALQLLQQCDVLLYDRLVPEAIVRRARRDARRVYVGKQTGQHRSTQLRINELLLAYARQGLRVARLKGGDPLVFARGGEELAALLAAGVPVTVVPGVTAASGAAAVAGISLTQRGVAQAVVLVTAMGAQAEQLDWRALAAPLQTVVFYMGVAELPHIVERLCAHGAPADRKVAIVERATQPGERVLRTTLGELVQCACANQVCAPALLIVGEVAGPAAARI